MLEKEKRRYYLIACILVVLSQSIFCQVRELTLKEKLEDFHVLYDELSTTYPFFSINKRQNGIDWLNNKQFYIEQISKTVNNEEFACVIRTILNGLNNSHTDFDPTVNFDDYRRLYEDNFLNNEDVFRPYVEQLRRPNALLWAEYWSDCFTKCETAQGARQKNVHVGKVSSGLHTRIIQKNLAYIQLPSFNKNRFIQEKPVIDSFLTELNAAQNLIIDIQGNSGGTDDYWRYIVSSLIMSSMDFPVRLGLRESAFYQKMRPHYAPYITSEVPHLPNLPPELLQGTVNERFRFIDATDNIEPFQKSIKFEGNIYLIVDKEVLSSAETFTYFCKATGFATVLGERTGGDGLGSDPFLLTLPNSGLVLRFTADMGLNTDGSANEEYATEPDILFMDSNKEKRLSQIINFVMNGTSSTILPALKRKGSLGIQMKNADNEMGVRVLQVMPTVLLQVYIFHTEIL